MRADLADRLAEPLRLPAVVVRVALYLVVLAAAIGLGYGVVKSIQDVPSNEPVIIEINQ